MVSPYWFGDPASPLRLLGRAGFPHTIGPAHQKRTRWPLFGFAFLQSLAQPTLAVRRSRRPLPWASAPFGTSGIGDPLAAGFACSLRSALRVWLPSRRLPPADAVPALSHAGSALGIHPSEPSPPRGRGRLSAAADPHAVSDRPNRAAMARPSLAPRLLGFDPSESPSRSGHMVILTVRRMLPWVLPFLGVAHRRPRQRSSRRLLSRAWLLRHARSCVHLRVSIGRRLARPRRSNAPSKVSAPA